MKLPWKCEDCGHEWEDSAFFTYVECMECGSEECYHGSIVWEDGE